MSSSQKRPFSREQKVRLRELLWPAMGGTSSPGMEGGEPGAPAAAEEFGGGAKGLQPPPQRPSPCGGGGWVPKRLIIHWGRSGLCGSIYRVHLEVGVTWGRVHEPTRQSRKFSHQWLPSSRMDRDRTQPNHVLLCALGGEAALTVFGLPLQVHSLMAGCQVPRVQGGWVIVVAVSRDWRRRRGRSGQGARAPASHARGRRPPASGRRWRRQHRQSHTPGPRERHSHVSSCSA